MKIKNPIKSHDVLVMATMSAGKSTLINALIGTELLPAMNEATTACHFNIRHEHKKIPFHGSALTENEHVHRDVPLQERKVIQEWNANKTIKKIELSGVFKGRAEYRNGLSFHDTPGPNNSQDEAHSAVAFDVASNTSFDTFLYVINATQIGITDDRFFLEKILSDYSEKMKRKPVFVLNKADLLDPEKGENIADCVRNVESYLISVGFKNPIIVPCASKLALCARKELSGEPMTRKQQWVLRSFFDSEGEGTGGLIEAAIMPEETRKQIRKKLKGSGMNDIFDFFRLGKKASRLKRAVSESGIRIIEELIVIQKEEAK